MKGSCARALIVASLSATGCFSYGTTYAPPLRAAQYGAPGRLTKGRVEIGATVSAVDLPQTGAAHIAVGLRDWIALEWGGNASLVAGGSGWLMGFVGSRLSWIPRPQNTSRLVSDLELGFGAGAGGALQGNAIANPHCRSGCGDGKTNWERTAGGGYQGIGIGWRFDWLTIFFRARLEETTATNVPMTLWPSAMLGSEAQIARHFVVTFGAGTFATWNRAEQVVGGFYQIGLTVIADAWR